VGYLDLPREDQQKTAVVDIDGVIATGTKEEVYSEEAGWAYDKCIPLQRGVEIVRGLKLRGIRVVLYTARFPEDEEVTRQWLNNFNVPYDELIMGKPQSDIYVDDKALMYQNGETTLGKVLSELDRLRKREIELEGFL
jgi:hypothetical protein